MGLRKKRFDEEPVFVVWGAACQLFRPNGKAGGGGGCPARAIVGPCSALTVPQRFSR